MSMFDVMAKPVQKNPEEIDPVQKNPEEIDPVQETPEVPCDKAALNDWNVNYDQVTFDQLKSEAGMNNHNFFYMNTKNGCIIKLGVLKSTNDGTVLKNTEQPLTLAFIKNTVGNNEDTEFDSVTLLLSMKDVLERIKTKKLDTTNATVDNNNTNTHPSSEPQKHLDITSDATTSSANPPRIFQIGDSVRIVSTNKEGSITLLPIDGDTELKYNIKFDDNTTAEVKHDDIELITEAVSKKDANQENTFDAPSASELSSIPEEEEFKVGDEVTVELNKGTTIFATIKIVNEDGTYDITDNAGNEYVRINAKESNMRLAKKGGSKFNPFPMSNVKSTRKKRRNSRGKKGGSRRKRSTKRTRKTRK